MRGEKWRVGMTASLELDTLTPSTVVHFHIRPFMLGLLDACPGGSIA